MSDKPKPHPWNDNREMLVKGDRLTVRCYDDSLAIYIATELPVRHDAQIMRVERPTYRDVPV